MITQTLSHDQRAPAILLTGASSGVGHALALQLARRGHKVIALGRDAIRLEALSRQQPPITPVAFDLAQTGGIDALARALLTEHPGIGILINNAGIQHDRRLDDANYNAAGIAEEIAINLTAPITLTRVLLPHLQQRTRATIVNVTSSLALVPKRTAATYSATKAGLRLFSDALRVQCGHTGVRVLEVILPLVDTPMTAGRGTGKISADDAAVAIADALHGDQPRLYIGKARALASLVWIAPSFAARVMQRS